jgi:phospholipid/cholesterol/gamma-HCH transport system substrate-binding protein
MRAAIRAHMRDFVALLGMVAIAIGITAYILSNQRLRFPLIQDSPTQIWVEMANARGVTPGQGQTVRVAGMRVGDVGKVELVDGKARVRMDLDSEYRTLVRRDATVLLRPRTGLKDMFLALDPGSPSERAVKEGEVLSAANTAPDVNADEILNVLDSDTRAYLKLLLNGAGKGLKDRRHDLRQVFYRLGPLHRDLDALNTEVVKRKRNLSRLIHNYGSTMTRLSREDRSLASLVRNNATVFERLAREDDRISLAVSRLPSALAQTESTLIKVNELGQVARPAFRALRPAVRRIHPANLELRPLAEEGEPVLRTRVRPFVRAARPYIANVGPAARNLGKAQPDLRESFYGLNRFFNLAAYNPGGKEPLTGDNAKDLARNEGYLFWLGWVAHNTVSMFSTGDAQGPFRRFIILATCSTYTQLLLDQGAAAPLLEDALGIKDLLADTDLCPPS